MTTTLRSLLREWQQAYNAMDRGGMPAAEFATLRRRTHDALAAPAAALSQGAEPVACSHRIADARNPVVTSGYMCIDCGALFAAAPKLASAEPEEIAGLIVRDVCESDPADPEHPDAVCVNVNDLAAAIVAHLEPAPKPASAPETFLQKWTRVIRDSDHEAIEAGYAADTARMNCPHCGGSGHVDDVASDTAAGAVPKDYSQTVIDALYENGDPVSVDAAEEIGRLLALIATPPAATQVPSEPEGERQAALEVALYMIAHWPSGSAASDRRGMRQTAIDALAAQPPAPRVTPAMIDRLDADVKVAEDIATRLDNTRARLTALRTPAAPEAGSDSTDAAREAEQDAVVHQHGCAMNFFAFASCDCGGSDTFRLNAITKHRIALVPEFQGGWAAEVYGKSEAATAIFGGTTPRKAIDAAISGSGKGQA